MFLGINCNKTVHWNTFLKELISLVASEEQNWMGGDGDQRECFPLYFSF